MVGAEVLDGMVRWRVDVRIGLSGREYVNVGGVSVVVGVFSCARRRRACEAPA